MTKGNVNRAEYAIGVALAIGAALLLAASILWGVNLEEDEIATTVVATVLQWRALLHGALPFWTPAVGFGIPLPGSASWLMHPLSILLAVLDVRLAVQLILLTHVGIALGGMWWLCRTVRLGPVSSGVCTASFLLSAPTLTYLLTDDQPTNFLAFSVAPALLAQCIRLLRRDDEPRRAASRVALVTGAMIAVGHMGHAPFLVGMLGVGVLAAPGRLRPSLGWLTLAMVLALAMAGDRIYGITTEYARFAASIPRPTDETLHLTQVWDLFFRPLLPRLHANWGELSRIRGLHLVYFGGPLAMLAVASSVMSTGEGWLRRVLWTTIAASLLVATAGSFWRIAAISQTYLFRDPIVLCGIVLGGMALESALARPAMRRWAWAAVALQVVALGGFAWIPMGDAFAQANANARVSAPAASTLTPALRELVSAEDGRIYLAPKAQALLYGGELPSVAQPMLWRTRAIAAGLPLINGVFKGVWAEPLAASSWKPYAEILARAPVARSRAALDVLGVRYLLSAGDEAVAPGLDAAARIAVAGTTVTVWAVPRAGGPARFVPSEVFRRPLPVQPSCDDDRLLCRDLSPILAASVPEPVEAVQRDDQLVLSFAPAPAPREIFLPNMFRPGWTATGDGAAATLLEPAWDAFTRVHVPAGASHIQLSYRPAIRILLTLASAVAFLVALAGACLPLAPIERLVAST